MTARRLARWCVLEAAGIVLACIVWSIASGNQDSVR